MTSGVSPTLPILDARERIEAAIRAHPVVVVCGETGSGKSTQLPQLCLAIGRGRDRRIGHTQPRRIAARNLAARIASERGSEPGREVGYKVRFSDQVGPDTRIKLMTDGMLLAEIRGDPLLREYDTLIIDEAHERSLNIDFLLGYLKQLLPKRPDLKVVITSATIDPERFSRHFDGAPVIEVSGRGYPVTIEYRPVAGEAGIRDRVIQAAIVDAVQSLVARVQGDILVFLATERDIRETLDVLTGLSLPHTEVLPLFARLSTREQQRVFAPHRGRRIVLATNVAETSVTVPGIHAVIDTGLVRLSRYSDRSKVQRLPIEPISQASAAQRAGRCGRVAPGVCIRLYAEDDWAARPEFTDPEILRSNLASVILQMAALGLGELDRFPFVEPPDRRHVNDGYTLLRELGAVDEQRRITTLGRQLAKLPVDPSVARMLVEGGRLGALAETLVIAAGLSVPDPRERPMDARAQADAMHAARAAKGSDFLGFLSLWKAYRQQATRLGRSGLRRWSQEQFLSLSRLRDWEEIHRQLRDLCLELGLSSNTEPGSARAIHRSVLSGFLGGVAQRDEDGRYRGARGQLLRIFPGSVLAAAKPKWIVAAEFVETSQVFARVAARIDPSDVERQARHLLRRHYSDVAWDPQAGRVLARERVSLHTLILAADRQVDYGRIDPVLARTLFIRQGLAEDRVDSAGGFVAHNRALIQEVEALEARTRRRDLLVDPEELERFFDSRVPADVCDLPTFERWRMAAERNDPQLLYLGRSDLLQRDPGEAESSRYPERLAVDGVRLPLNYHFEPGAVDDGVTVTVPQAVLKQLRPARFESLVPGLLEEKITQLIRGLPKRLRKRFVPAPEYAKAVAAALTTGSGSLIEGVRAELKRMTGEDVPPEEWAAVTLPEHLLMRFRVIDGDGRTLAVGRDLADLQRRFGSADLTAMAPAVAETQEAGDPPPGPAWSGSGYTRWQFGAIPSPYLLKRHGADLTVYPALEDTGDSVRQVLVGSEREAGALTRAAVRRLLRIALRQSVQVLVNTFRRRKALHLRSGPMGGSQALFEAMLDGLLDRVFPQQPIPGDAAAFRALLDQGRARFVDAGTRLIDRLETILERQQWLQREIDGLGPVADPASLADLRAHLDSLVFPGFITALPTPVFDDLERYLKALTQRVEKLRADPVRDRDRVARLRPWLERYRHRAGLQAARGDLTEGLQDFRVLLEEYRVSLFAQGLGTRMPVSDKRLEARWQALR